MKRKRVTAKLIIAPNPILTQVCEPVKDGEDVSGIIRDMLHVLLGSKNGVGLAAPQAGHLKRIILIKLRNFSYIPMINPTWRRRSSGRITMSEGCLSYPNKYKDIERFGAICVNYQAENGSEYVDCEFINFEARIIQHEIDHLNGKCRVGA